MTSAHTAPAASPAPGRPIISIDPSARRVLLACGVFSSLLYVATDVIAALRWDGYSYATQTISELMSIGSPVRPFMVRAFTIYDLLMVGFGVAVLASAGAKRALLASGALLVSYSIVGLVGLHLFPMHQRGVEGSSTDTMHIAVSSVMVLMMLFAIAFGSAANGRAFRLYSIVTIFLLLAFGALTGLQAPRMAAGLPTPWMGLEERVNVYGFMLWIAVLAGTLWILPESPAKSGRS